MSNQYLESEFAQSMLRFRAAIARIDRPRNSPLDTAAICLVDAFQKWVSRFEDHERLEHWEKWINAQAHLVWRYKGYPENQAPERGFLDDQKEAKRYLGYLLADDLLKRLRDRGECPAAILSTERMRYLLCLSVEEFARYRAYFAYRERIGSRIERESKHYGDYQTALRELNDFLDLLVERPIVEDCKGCRPVLFDRHRLCDSSHTSVESIKKAKKYVLERLKVNRDIEEGHLEKCVDAFYPWLRTGSGPIPPQDIHKDLCHHFAVTNMFEYFAICLLVHRVERPGPPTVVVAGLQPQTSKPSIHPN